MPFDFEKGYRPKGRKPQKEPIPFQEKLPLALRNKVSGKGYRSSTAICLQEMAVMFACLKSKEFHESNCKSEIESFQKCANDFNTNNAIARAAEKKLGLENTAPGSSTLNFRQLNNFLRKFPHPK